MIVDFTQRWTQTEGTGKRAEYIPLRPFFAPRNFEIEPISESQAKNFVMRLHYSGSYPAARRRFGFFERGLLVGAAVYSHPMSEKVITNTFGCQKASDGLELGRLVLKTEVLSNAESFFVAECNRRLKKEGFCGVVSFSDDFPRTAADGELTHVGHLGIVYQSLNAVFLGRNSPAKIHLLPDGRVLGARTISKIRSGESGTIYASRILEDFGADDCPEDSEKRKIWLKFWLGKLTRRFTHPGNLKYAWIFSSKIKLKGKPYPKIRFKDLQQSFNF